MADIDMIPRSYREALRVRRLAIAYGAALALLLAAGGGASALLRWRVAVETPRLEQLRAGSTQADAMRSLLAAAQGRRDAYAQDIAALAALRGSGEVASLAAILDGALGDGVWIEGLRFSRTQEQLPQAAAAAAPLPAGTVQVGTPGTSQAWRLGSQLDIAGQAQDHAAMTAFLAALASNPALSDVRFMNSSAPAEEGGEAADGLAFTAAASLVKQGATP